LAVAAIAGLGSSMPAAAQGKLEARYTASLAGIPIGRGAWVIDIEKDRYLAAASGTTAGLLRLFSSGKGTGAARGKVVNGELVPATYAVTLASKKHPNEVRIELKSGSV
jgi:hypothetical protein